MPKVSEAHVAARRRQIITAATRLFAERGFSRTTMAHVVAASGLSTGAVYSYFPSKSDLMLAVVAGRDGSLGGQLTDETPVELVTRLTGYVAPVTGAAHARLIAQIWGDAAVEPALAAVVRATHERLQDHLDGLLVTSVGGDRGDRDSAPSAQVALAALIGLAALVAAGIPVEMDHFAESVLRLLDPPPRSLTHRRTRRSQRGR